jgi:catechol 2,3-dioxygenase
MAKPFHQTSPSVEIGRVHLRVADLDRALAFYEGILGFEITQRAGHSAALLSSGGVRHDIWLHAGDGEMPLVDAGERTRFALRVASRAALGSALRRLEQSGVTIAAARDQGVSEALHLFDPDGNGVELYYERPAAEWPREADGSPRLAASPLDLESLRTTVETPAGEASAAPAGEPQAPLLSGPTRTRLQDMRQRLLNLHKVLLEDAKTAYELDRGRVGSNASLLQLVINDPWFAWLHQLSELVVRIDEWLQGDTPATEADGLTLLEHVARLLSPEHGPHEFARRYYEALQRQPAVIVAHAEVRRILKQAK